MNRRSLDDPPVNQAADLGLEVDLISPPPEQPRILWGDILALPEPGAEGEKRIEARVRMYPDKSRFFVHYPSGKEEILSPTQFVALVLELKRSRRFAFDRRKA